MGGCCFTPKKTQLLWWYWLLLFSIVGIPMFAAALYVRRAARHGVLEPCQVRRASRIFWLGACFSMFLVSVLLFFFFEFKQLSGERYWDVIWFAISFLFWLMVAVGAAKLTEKAHPWYARAAVVTCCAMIPAGLTWLPYAALSFTPHSAVGLLPMGVMKFLACMLPAQYWYRFTVSPGIRRAWLFLGALAVGTIFFWVVSQYGEAAHAGICQWLNLTRVGLHRI
jgi:hypothetical protein